MTNTPTFSYNEAIASFSKDKAMAGNFGLAFLLCAVAGMSTGVGAFALFFKRGRQEFLAAALGFAAGVMLYISFVEILNKAAQNLVQKHGDHGGGAITLLSFFGGIALVIAINGLFCLITKKTKHNETESKCFSALKLNPPVTDSANTTNTDTTDANTVNTTTHNSDAANATTVNLNTLNSDAPEGDFSDYSANSSLLSSANTTHITARTPKKSTKNASLLKTGLLTAVAMAIHNFPEGLTTFISAYHDPNFAISVVIAIAIHNIPEGIAVSVPVYYATNSRVKAILVALASGMVELVGALVGYLILSKISLSLYGILFAAVAGMMVWISIFELIPSGREYGKKLCAIGFLLGLIVISISLLFI